MAGTTEDGYPYPDPEDMLADGAGAVKDLAESIEIYRGTTDPGHAAGRIWVKPLA